MFRTGGRGNGQRDRESFNWLAMVCAMDTIAAGKNVSFNARNTWHSALSSIDQRGTAME
jgi:hypothetical protein